MRFWDASALAPLLLVEARTDESRRLLQEDPEVLTWWGTRLECRSALYRPVHAGRRPPEVAARAETMLDRLSTGWTEVQPTDAVRETAERLLRGHPLRAGDALQLAAALVAAEFRPSGMPFVCYDDRLAAAARREGFRILGAANLPGA